MTRRLGVAIPQLGWGAVLLLAPRSVIVAAGATPDDRSVALARVLGARRLVQGGALAASRTPRTLRWATLVDAAHAASMAGVAIADPPRRRLAWFSCAGACGFAALGLLAGRRPS